MNGTVNEFPPGWDEEHVQDIIKHYKHYDSLTDDEWAAEIEAAFEDNSHTVMVIPNDLVPAVSALLSESASAPPLPWEVSVGIIHSAVTRMIGTWLGPQASASRFVGCGLATPGSWR